VLSKSDAKHEERFAGRIDVLSQRVDTLAATVATTASALARKDGELAALRKELDARDARLADFLAQARQGEGGTDSRELRELQKTVESLAADGSKQPGSKQIEQLAAKVTLIAERLDTLATTVSTTAAGLAGREGELATIRKRLESPLGPGPVPARDDALRQQIERISAAALRSETALERQGAELEALKAEIERRQAEPERPSEELRAMLAALRTQVEALSGLRAGVTEEQLEARVAETDGAVARLSQGIDALTENVTAAAVSLGDKEHELAALHRHFTESSSRIETVVGDIREALSALPDPASFSADDLAAHTEDVARAVESLTGRIDRVETTIRQAETRERSVDELPGRLAAIDQRVAAVATELAHAKTLWPVALRSLEARLDDAITHGRPSESTADGVDAADPQDEPSDDLLASLRDSLQAMETVAAEMARASDALGTPDEDEDRPEATAAAGGATVVPLRASDP
jgi:chromosome segregation ATPase